MVSTQGCAQPMTMHDRARVGAGADRKIVRDGVPEGGAMRSVGEQIRDGRRVRRMTLQQLADQVRCTRSYLSQVENNRRENPPSESLLGRIEKALGLDTGVLVRVARFEQLPSEYRVEMKRLRAGERKAALLAKLMLDEGGLDAAYRSGMLSRLVRDLAPEDAKGVGAGSRLELLGGVPMQVPLINRVQAGYPREFTDLGYPARVADEYVSVPDVQDADAFAARVVGDSMEPDYREGDIVVFSPLAGTPAASDCFVRFERDEETTFKRVYFEVRADGCEMIRLQPLNSAYPPRVVDREEVAGMYKAVYVVRPITSG